MAVATLALLGLLIATYLLLFKLGALGTIACGKGGGCETVQTSPWAVLLGVPVAAWGVVGYLAIFGVALAGVQPLFAGARWVSWTLLALTGIALAFSLYLTALEAWVIHAWCRWCVASAIVAGLVFGAALPEVSRVRRAGSGG
jgi:uncharacterized membrane protein